MRASRAAGVLMGAGLLLAPLLGLLAAQPVDYAAERAAIARYQDADQRLQDVGWQLVRGNAGFCPRAVPAIGLQLQDMASYGAPAIVRRAIGGLYPQPRDHPARKARSQSMACGQGDGLAAAGVGA